MRACWVVLRNEKEVKLFYDNKATGLRHQCGSQPAYVTDQQVLEWVLENGGIGEGDMVRLSSGEILHFQMPGDNNN